MPKFKKRKRTKLEDKSQKCILLGYEENSRDYKLYNTITKKIIVLKNVQFDEEQVWDFNGENKPYKLTLEREQVQKDEEEFQVIPCSSPIQALILLDL